MVRCYQTASTEPIPGATDFHMTPERGVTAFVGENRVLAGNLSLLTGDNENTAKAIAAKLHIYALR